jgi:hypothetical protein
VRNMASLRQEKGGGQNMLWTECYVGTSRIVALRSCATYLSHLDLPELLLVTGGDCHMIGGQHLPCQEVYKRRREKKEIRK